MTRKTAAKTALATIALAAVLAVGLGADAAMARMGESGSRPALDFDALDTDADGRITRPEMDAWHAGRFARIDADGDGFVTAAELQAHFGTEAHPRAERMVKRMIEKLDKDDDGRISAAELEARPRPARMFDRLDSDGDGAITRAELETAQTRMAERREKKGHGRHTENRDKAKRQNAPAEPAPAPAPQD